MIFKEIRFYYWTRNLTVYNMTKDLYPGHVAGVILGVFDLVKFLDIFERLPLGLSPRKYLGFEGQEV